ncbi:unnamed protein product [Chironomus riparius]|uniref:Uncharacterized protein n=1 Tax=Chironomus riparius TaxID=315576 RepID=A0A9N9RK46_9DIPT|nr:unnamed protein product [Chironomus riparius]
MPSSLNKNSSNICESDSKCKQNEYCNDKTQKCIIGCRLDRNCGQNKYCDEDRRMCTSGCYDNRDCDMNEICDINSKMCIFKLSARSPFFDAPVQTSTDFVTPQKRVISLAAFFVLTRLANHENSTDNNEKK